MDLLIYSNTKSSRVEYIFEHIFNYIFGLEINFVHDAGKFLKHNGPKINYSKKSFSDELFFYSSDILFENNIRQKKISLSKYRDIDIFFLCDVGALPFDPFAASFYMLTRYEEYLAHKKDKIGRFLVENSLAFQNQFLTQPVVDHWILFIKDKLINYFPNLILKQHKFSFINTIDVDNAYAYLGKGVLRTCGSIFMDVCSFSIKNIYNRIKVLCGKEKDPYDNYHDILRLHNKYNLETIFFFLIGNYGKYDRNVNYLMPKFRQQIKNLSSYCKIGLHTSFKSIKKTNQIAIERKRIEDILQKTVVINRQHFLSLNIPSNYRNFIKNGIAHDYSMGYPSHPGFRAGTSFSFYFFDLEVNNATSLKVHPFSLMDVTLKHYCNLEPNSALDIIKKIINSIKIVNGTFISIWHNESLSDKGKWVNWKSVYEDMVKFINNAEN